MRLFDQARSQCAAGLTHTCAPLTPLSLQSKAQSSDLAWRLLFCDVPLPRGLIAAATYLREHAASGAIVANPPDPLDDAFIALSERPAFFPGNEFLSIQSGLPPAALTARHTALAEILAAPDAGANGITWVVTFPPAGPSPRAVFDNSGYTVIHLKPAS